LLQFVLFTFSPLMISIFKKLLEVTLFTILLLLECFKRLLEVALFTFELKMEDNFKVAWSCFFYFFRPFESQYWSFCFNLLFLLSARWWFRYLKRCLKSFFFTILLLLECFERLLEVALFTFMVSDEIKYLSFCFKMLIFTFSPLIFYIFNKLLEQLFFSFIWDHCWISL